MRQMGGMYLYSFDISVLLFGVCFNLAGLPYSAGFLGKEFLLFQVLRDDYISLLVRSCWLVSFFFTPIYMFILVFLVMFDVKKGSIISYKSNWGFKLIENFYSLYKFLHIKTSKKLVAYSTISQIGYLICGCGWSPSSFSVASMSTQAIKKKKKTHCSVRHKQIKMCVTCAQHMRANSYI